MVDYARLAAPGARLQPLALGPQQQLQEVDGHVGGGAHHALLQEGASDGGRLRHEAEQLQRGAGLRHETPRNALLRETPRGRSRAVDQRGSRPAAAAAVGGGAHAQPGLIEAFAKRFVGACPLVGGVCPASSVGSCPIVGGVCSARLALKEAIFVCARRRGHGFPRLLVRLGRQHIANVLQPAQAVLQHIPASPRGGGTARSYGIAMGVIW